MPGLFSFTEAQMLDSNKVKIIYGVAGRGKSSQVVDFLEKHGIPFLWTTSTNKLKRDAQERYGCEASTVASSLFTNEHCKFYQSEKDPDRTTVVIDEILQTSPKVLDWIKSHRSRYNIIVLTDIKQMLAKETGIESTFLRKFKEFMTDPSVLLDEGTETKRARDAETKAKIEDLYTKSDDGYGEFDRDIESGLFNIITYEEMEFTTRDIYITHLNATEDQIYRDFKLSEIPLNTDDMIPKGGIASKPPKDPSKYPRLSQNQAEKMRVRSYYQLKNIGSCTRYQGSECTDTQTLYYVITPTSKISNREWYTVVSRCWKLSSIVIVIADGQKPKAKTFNGKKIKEVMTLAIIGEEN